MFILYLIINNCKATNIECWEDELTETDKIIRNRNDCTPIKTEQILDSNMKYNLNIVPNSCEDGLPHTTSKYDISIPEKFMKHDIKYIIAHEKVHLRQRQELNKWTDFYKKYWFYTLHKNPPNNMPNELIKNRRSNPDTDGNVWCCWNSNYWAVPIYNSGKETLYNIIVKWWDEKNNIITNYPPKEWIDFFGNDNMQSEHPHEISAVYIEKYIRNNKILSEAMNLLIEQWNYDKYNLK